MSRARRRQLLAAACGLLVSPIARSQSRARAKRLAYLYNHAKPAANAGGGGAFKKAYAGKLASLGWVEGKNLVIDRTYNEGGTDRLPSLVAELVRKPVDAILVFQTATAVAAARGTKVIPIVLAGASAYPVECGLIRSFARPGTNVTGIAWFQGIEVHSKLAQFVREVLPSAKRLAWLAFPPDLIDTSGSYFRPEPYYAKIANSLALDFRYFECSEAADIEPVYRTIVQWRPDALIVEPANLSYWEAPRLAALAKQAQLPSLYGITYNVVHGGLIGYSPNVLDLHRTAFDYVDRIFRGANPAELPVSMPTKLELSVNLRTAKALGISIPPSLLLSADRVIE